MPFTVKEQKIIDKIPRHGFLTEPIKRHLLTGVAAGTIRERELIELGARIKQHIADKKGHPEYEKRVAFLRELQRQALEKTPDTALSHLLNSIPNAENALTRAAKATGKALAKVVMRHRSPTESRQWSALEKNVVAVQVVNAPKTELAQFRPDIGSYRKYIRRLLKKTSTRKHSIIFELTVDKISRLFPGRPELIHLKFKPMVKADGDWWSDEGNVKTPEIVIEPVIQLSPDEMVKAREEVAARRFLSYGQLVGHRIHIFERGTHYKEVRNFNTKNDEMVPTSNEQEALQLARKMARFFKHDVQVVKHYNY